MMNEKKSKELIHFTPSLKQTNKNTQEKNVFKVLVVGHDRIKTREREREREFLLSDSVKFHLLTKIF